MKKITYRPTALSKQFWFYFGVLYLVLTSVMSILIEVYKVPGFYEEQNLLLVLFANVIGMAFFILLSLGHHTCYSEYDDEKVIYHNRLTRKVITFYYKDATSIIFDKKGAKFYNNNDDLVNKKPPLFMVPFFRDGKIEAIPIDQFYKFMKAREEEIGDPEKFKVYRTYKVLPGYSGSWKYLSFAYACLAFLTLINCSSPAAVILGLMMSF